MSNFSPDAGNSLNTSLTQYYKMEEAAGAVRVDQVNAENLTDNATVGQSAGKKGNAAHFTAASSQYLSRASDATLQVGDIDFSIACWVYLDSLNVDRDIVVKFNNQAGVFPEYELSIAGGTNKPSFKIYDVAYTNNAVLSSTVLSTATWYFLVAQCDKTGGNIYISVNGGARDSAAKTKIVSSAGNTGPFSIGALDNNGVFVSFFDGRIDEVGVWKKVLSAQEISDLYNGGSGNTYNVPSVEQMVGPYRELIQSAEV